jgi:hypothetical protein
MSTVLEEKSIPILEAVERMADVVVVSVESFTTNKLRPRSVIKDDITSTPYVAG